MMVDTADISIIVDNACYNWIKLYDTVIKTPPEDNTYLGKYLGQAIDAGPDLTEKILKSNGEAVHLSTYHYLLYEEVNDEKN